MNDPARALPERPASSAAPVAVHERQDHADGQTAKAEQQCKLRYERICIHAGGLA